MKKYIVIDIVILWLIFLLTGIVTISFINKLDEYSTPLPVDEKLSQLFDVKKEDWFYKAIEYLDKREFSNEILYNHKFEPNKQIEPATFIALLYNAFKEHIEILENQSIQFEQRENITIERVANIIYNFAKRLKGNNITASDRYIFNFKDKNSISYWAYDGLNWCLQENIFEIKNDNLGPQEYLTRAQAIQSISNLIAWYNDSALSTNRTLECAPILNTEKHIATQNEINEISKRFGAVGVSVVYIEDGKITDTFAYGSAIKNMMSMSVDTKIRIASMSKAFVGLATMISVENGTMSLDASIGDYWGFNIGTHAKGDTITPRSILTHTSSLMDISENISNTYYSGMANILRTGSGIRNFLSGNISNWNYNNYAVEVLGVTVELANNKELDEILSNYIFEPLSIDASFYGGNLINGNQIGTLYYYGGGVARSASYTRSLHRDGIPGSRGNSFAGGLMISAYDLAKIVVLLANDGIYEGVRYLPSSIIENLEYHDNNLTRKGFWQAQPLRYFTDIYGQDEIYTIGGDAYGTHNVLSYNPNTKKGVVILTTGANPLPDSNGLTILSAISSLLYKE